MGVPDVIEVPWSRVFVSDAFEVVCSLSSSTGESMPFVYVLSYLGEDIFMRENTSGLRGF